MAIKLSNNDLTNFDCLVECFGLGVACLTDTTVHHKNGRVRYAYTLRIGGIAYSITDVEVRIAFIFSQHCGASICACQELHLWMKGHFEEHPLFEVTPLTS